MLRHGMDSCRILSHMCDCTTAENPNEAELKKALDNTALDKNTDYLDH